MRRYRTEAMDENTNFGIILEKLEELKSLTKTWYTPQEAALYAGCSVDTLRSYMYKGELAYSKPTGGRVFISKKDLDEFLSKGRIPSKYEIEAQASNYIASKR